VSLVKLETVDCILRRLMRGNEKAVLDLTFPKMVTANTVKFTCFDDEGRE